MERRRRLLLILVIVIPLFAVAIDIRHFWRACKKNAIEANLEIPRRKLKKTVPREAIVVLTGDKGRIAKAIELLKSRGSSLLIISGTGRGITLTNLVNQQGDAVVHVQPIWKKIVLEPRSASTLENAEESGKLLLRHRIRRTILVTSDYHMARASSVFRKTLPQMEIEEYPVPSEFFPKVGLSPRSLGSLWIFLIEYFKHLVYALFYSFTISPMGKPIAFYPNQIPAWISAA